MNFQKQIKMINKDRDKLLYSQLKEISEILEEKYIENIQTGVLSGISGLSLFQFYYAKFLNKDEHAEIAADIIKTCIEKIGNGDTYWSYCSGAAGAGWVLSHLEQFGFVDVDIDQLLNELDVIFHRNMIEKIKIGHYDFLHGAIGYGFYFLKRYINTKSIGLKERYKNYLLELIVGLRELSENDGDKVKWLSVLNHKTGEMAYNFSLSHGISSIINFLSRLYLYNDFKKEVYPMLVGGIEYIKSHMGNGKEELSLFPNWILKGTDNSINRVAWCYGDLGIGLSFWQASKALNNDKLRYLAMKILKHSSKRTTPGDTKVNDPMMCHGSFGNAQIFNRMYHETDEIIFRETANFWIKDGLEKAIHSDGYVGYKMWDANNSKWRSDMSILNGIAGIGLSIISFLSGENSWDECLMIG